MKQKRLAAIDIGSNSIRCIVVEVDNLGKFRVMDDEKADVRLGEKLGKDGALSPVAWQRAMDALARMNKIIDGYGVVGIEGVATSAVRRAANGDAFVRAVAETVGFEISVIGGEEEAELVALSALNNFDMAGTRHVMVDIGGGSVEVVTAFGNNLEEIFSLELGAVAMTEQFIGSDPINRHDYRQLRKQIRTTLRSAITGEVQPAQCLLGSGGTMTAIASMVMAMGKERFGSIHGYEVLRSQVVHLLAMLLRKDVRERRSIPGLSPDRADIIVAGVTVVDELMGLFKANVLKVNERGIREGLILRGLQKHRLIPAESRPRNWRDSILEFARSCHDDEEHSLQVARLALEIFDSLASSFGLGPKERQMLEAAALAHDVGYFIGYSGHHKHTYHLVRHADLFGFTPREREVIAQVARYHRKALPSKKHESFARLVPPDRLLVKMLGGILRVSDGLDRRRNSQVAALQCSLSPAIFMITVAGGGDVSVELFGGKLKGDLFEEAFGRKLVLVANGTS